MTGNLSKSGHKPYMPAIFTSERVLEHPCTMSYDFLNVVKSQEKCLSKFITNPRLTTDLNETSCDLRGDHSNCLSKVDSVIIDNFELQYVLLFGAIVIAESVVVELFFTKKVSSVRSL